MQFKDKVVIVTGASSGIGREVALAFSRKGARVVVNGRDRDRIDAVVTEIRANGNVAVGVPANVSKKNDAAGLVESALDAFGQIDVLVNNAGGSRGSRSVADLLEDDWDQVVADNLKSVFLCSQAALPALKRQKSGKIVNVASQAGRAQSVLAGPHYAAAKAGVIGFTKQLAKELAEFGINVNAVAPGIVRSGPRVEAMWDSFSPEFQARFISDIPLGRLGENHEVASAVLFLASDGASYLVGATLDVNGGRWMI